jgi:hypothetical protein
MLLHPDDSSSAKPPELSKTCDAARSSRAYPYFRGMIGRVNPNLEIARKSFSGLLGSESGQFIKNRLEVQR